MTLVLDHDLRFEEGDPLNPRNWPQKKKIINSILPLFGALCVTSSNSIYLASVPYLVQEFRLSTTMALLPITLYTIGLGLGPIISAAVSETYGRRPIYFISLTGTLAFTVIGGSAAHFRTIAVARFFASFMGAPMVTIVIGTLNDMWDSVNDKAGSTFLALYAAMLIWGTEIGPPIGQAMIDDTGKWQWTFWVTCILLGASCITWICPETYGPQILRQKAKKDGKRAPPRGSFGNVLKVVLGRPLHMLAVEPIIFPTSFIASLALCVVFYFYVAFPLVFERYYGFTQYQVGLAFLSLFIGSILGLVVMGILDKRKYQASRIKAESIGEEIEPEQRLYPVMVGGILLPISLFWFGWTARPSVHWAVPLVAGVPFGMAYFLVMLGWPLYKNDVYGTSLGASALAAENLIRYLLCCSMPLWSIQMIDNIGVGWATSIAGFIALALVPLPWIVFKYGPMLRYKSRYVPLNRKPKRLRGLPEIETQDGNKEGGNTIGFRTSNSSNIEGTGVSGVKTEVNSTFDTTAEAFHRTE